MLRNIAELLMQLVTGDDVGLNVGLPSRRPPNRTRSLAHQLEVLVCKANIYAQRIILILFHLTY